MVFKAQNSVFLFNFVLYQFVYHQYILVLSNMADTCKWP